MHIIIKNVLINPKIVLKVALTWLNRTELRKKEKFPKNLKNKNKITDETIPIKSS